MPGGADADLEAHRARRAVQQLDAVELGRLGDAVDLVDQAVELLVDRVLVLVRGRAVADWIASSRRRVRMLLTSLSAPSPVCTREMPSLALREAWSSERTCERRRSLIARPAASSAAVEMRRPVDRRR
jgi:hypothetical protein